MPDSTRQIWNDYQSSPLDEKCGVDFEWSKFYFHNMCSNAIFVTAG